MFLHHIICSVHFPTVQKHTGFETIPHLYWKNDKGVEPANGFQPAFSGHSVIALGDRHHPLPWYVRVNLDVEDTSVLMHPRQREGQAS